MTTMNRQLRKVKSLMRDIQWAKSRLADWEKYNSTCRRDSQQVEVFCADMHDIIQVRLERIELIRGM